MDYLVNEPYMAARDLAISATVIAENFTMTDPQRGLIYGLAGVANGLAAIAAALEEGSSPTEANGVGVGVSAQSGG